MGQSSINATSVTARGRGRYPQNYIDSVEQELCLSHALAFERVFAWPTHASMVGQEVIRFHNEGCDFFAYDVRGIFRVPLHTDAIVQRLVYEAQPRLQAAFPGGAELKTRCLGEDGVRALGVEINEARISECETQIRCNEAYASFVPIRPYPRYPGTQVERYSFGMCVAYAEALSQFTGLPAVTMTATAVVNDIVLGNGNIHAAVLHPDGDLEDVWGKRAAEQVAQGYGFRSWRLSSQEHDDMVEQGKRLRPGFLDEIEEASSLVRAYRAVPTISRSV